MSNQPMTPEEKRIRIAELCGWKRNHDGSLVFYWVSPNGDVSHHATNRYLAHEQLPDYLNDLNAMHAAEKTLRRPRNGEYDSMLVEISRRDATWFFHLSAEQRAEAFLAIHP